MRESGGCALFGVALLFVLYGLFFLMAMMEPGVAILIGIAGVFVGVGTIVAAIVWIFETTRSRPSD